MLCDACGAQQAEVSQTSINLDQRRDDSMLFKIKVLSKI